MCGIAGIVYRNLDQSRAANAVRQMIALQKHRGPDGEGFYDSVGVSLGHTRLAIIDLSDTGKQPMSDSNNRFWLTFNGEIYNYIELAGELKTLGHLFNGNSDTEVLLHAYMQWGKGCVSHLRGMFAFAVWDEFEKQLFVARDRLGIKPFHYWSDSHGNLFFSSEIKALLPFITNRKIHIQLARDYIAWNLLDHDDSQTMIYEIKRLSPGHTMTWNPGQGVHILKYWELQKPEKVLKTSGQNKKFFHEFRERFNDVIRLHLRSDVPVGTCLSGGLDSSAIVGTINKQFRIGGDWKNSRQSTFSACFEASELDERPYIDEVVKNTGIEPHYVFPSGEQLRMDLKDWIWFQEEPVSSTNPYIQYCVTRLASRYGIKVLLDGQGADEQLAGYRKFIFVYLRQLLRQRKYLTAFHEGLSFFLNPEILRLSRFVDYQHYLSSTPHHASILWGKKVYLKKPSLLHIGYSLNDQLHQDITRLSLPLLLRYEDRNSMAFGVEARVPFVDHELVEWLIKLPSDMRLYHGWTKRILRESLSDVLPLKVKCRKIKPGSLTPQTKWLSGPLKSWVLEILQSPNYLPDIVEPEGVQQLLLRYQQGFYSPYLLNSLFRLAVFEFWARLFLGNRYQTISQLKN